jgi:hypothetical protein
MMGSKLKAAVKARANELLMNELKPTDEMTNEQVDAAGDCRWWWRGAMC